jgi:hypothetical protein
VDAFVADPTVPAGKTAEGVAVPAENLGPISREDDALLKWLYSVKGPNLDERKLDKTSIPQRLKLIRGLPTQMTSQIRNECELYDAFLGVVLELEIASGNS